MNLLRVVDAVSKETNVPARDILGKSRLQTVVLARREAMKRMYIECRRNTPEIAKFFGVRPTSVRHHLITAGVTTRRAGK